MGRTLFDISEEYRALDYLLAEQGGDLTSEEVETYVDSLLEEMGRVRSELAEKVDGYVTLLAELDARAELRRAESKRLSTRARIDEDHAKYLKERLKDRLTALGFKSLETPRYRVTVAINGGKVPVLVSPDWNPDFMREQFYNKVVNYELDKDAIRAALEAGEDVAYCELGERGTSLRIK